MRHQRKITLNNFRCFIVFLFLLQCSFWAWVLRGHSDLIPNEAHVLKRTTPSNNLLRCIAKNLGHLDVYQIVNRIDALTPVEEFNMISNLIDAGLAYGGKSSPTNCRSVHNIAIVVPYRNRPNQLNIFVRYMHSLLQKQLMRYTIFVVEQVDKLPFNRGALLNVGFVEANNHDPPFDCFIFHDVDLLPEDERNLYSCPEQGRPRQLAFAIDIYDFEPVQRGYAGGVTAIAAKDFVRVNGFSNDYWGWGSEDDDFSRRMSHRNMTLVRSTDLDSSAIEYSTYRTLYHPKEKENADRGEVFHRKAVPHEMLTDGLFNLLSFIQRKTVATTLYYTHVSVEFDSKKVNRQYPI